MTLLGVGVVGTAVFLLLRSTSSWSQSDSTAAGGGFDAFKRALAIFLTKDMIMLSVTNFYTGLMQTFWSGVYGPSIANTAVSIWHAYQTINLGGTFAWFEMQKLYLYRHLVVMPRATMACMEYLLVWVRFWVA